MNAPGGREFYLGTFLIAFSTLAMEIALTRLLSVVTWYHLAFFAIATAMLGMTAGATVVFLNPQRYAPEALVERVVGACLRFALTVPVTLCVMCLLPLVYTKSLMTLIAMLMATAVCSVPYYHAGIALTLVLTRHHLPIGRLYASDLVGAAFGCLFVLFGMERLDAPSLILLCGAGGAASAAVYARSLGPRRVVALSVLTVGLVTAGLLNSTSAHLIRPFVVKSTIAPAYFHELERWNSFSRVTLDPVIRSAPQYWGPSPLAPTTPIEQRYMAIDGEAGTIVRRYQTPADVEHLRYDVTSVAYFIGSPGPACVIGLGGGRDVQVAHLAGHRPIVGLDVNPVFIDLHRGLLRDFSGLAHRPEVQLLAREARSHLSSTKERFSIIQMSLIDTWAATGAGAFALSENSLYTVEAWSTFLDRLTADGLFTVSRWHNPENLGETGRAVSLAVAALLSLGVEDPSRHIAMVAGGRCATLILSRRPFDEATVQKLRDVCQRLRFRTPLLPGAPVEHPDLKALMGCRSVAELRRVASVMPLRYEPPTDEDPYFFNMLRLSHLKLALGQESAGLNQHGVFAGNLRATLTLLGLIAALGVLALATVIVPLMLRRRASEAKPEPVLLSGLVYFSLIGAGFMLVEIALIQRLSVLLSHPTYALGVLLFTMILSTGLGSLLSERLPCNRRPFVYLLPVIAAGAVLVARFVLNVVLERAITQSLDVKVAASVAVIAPLGLVMGLFFPMGMRLVRDLGSRDTPWYWALNGVFGVLCSALAVFISIFLGISTNLHLGAACYLLLLPAVVDLVRRKATQAPAAASATAPSPGPA